MLKTRSKKTIGGFSIIMLMMILLAVVSGCSRREKQLTLGLIAASTDWLPVALAIEKGLINPDEVKIHYFSSGWEVNEALIGRRIDLAIMPFTYAWKGVSEGKDIRIISFFERESDGIVTQQEITELQQLEGKKVGVLRASTLDVFLHLVADKKGFNPEIIYFRTPTEMAAALQAGSVDALSYYVPQIFRLGEGFNRVYWYSEDFMFHPCCDIVATGKAIASKRERLAELLSVLDECSNYLQQNREKAIELMMKTYRLSQQEAEMTLQHTGFQISLDEAGKQFELMTAEKMLGLGYLRNVPQAEEVIYNGILKMVRGNE